MRKVRHLKRGSDYEIVSAAFAQVSTIPIQDGDLVNVYRNDKGQVFVRKDIEFDADRFAAVAPPPLTVSRLDQAIENVLGNDHAGALRGEWGPGRIVMHRMAIEKAFLRELTGDDVYVLREMGRQLEKRGEYPKESWDVTE